MSHQKYNMKKTEHHWAWLVHLATRAKRRINEMVRKCPINMIELDTNAY